MEDHLKLKKISWDQQLFGNSGKSSSVQANKSHSLCDKLKPEKQSFSYADLHHEITKDVEIISSKQARNHHKQCGKAIKEEELVKYMSNLPSYLERGERCQENVLNFGVLDWGRLEKWQCHQEQIPERTSRHSLSCGSPSLSFSTDGKSVHSNRGNSCSPSLPKTRRPSLQFHLMSSPIESHSQAVGSFEQNVGSFPDTKSVQSYDVNERGKITKTVQTISRNHPDIKMYRCERKDFDSKTCPGSVNLVNGVNNKALQKIKVKQNTKTQDGEFVNKAQNVVEKKTNIVDQDVFRESGETVGLLMPTSIPKDNHSGIPLHNESIIGSGQWAAEASRRSFSEMPEEIYLGAVSSDIPHSCPLPCELDRCSDTKLGSMDRGCYSFLPDSSQSVPHPVKKVFIPSHGRISEVKKATVIPATSTSKELSWGPDQKPSELAAEKVEKVRSTSPFRRLSIGMSKISKSFRTKEVTSAPKLSSCNIAKSGSVNAMASSRQDTSNVDTQNTGSRARSSSPLRRLLDPLVKPKVSHCHQSSEPLKRDEIPMDKACRSSNGKLDCSSQVAKCGSSTFQALLRVAVKNGQPMFTFAVDNESDILAATMKKLSNSREDYSCIYTFFAIQEVKKKNGRWIIQGNKGKGPDYIPSVVAQLKVFGSQFSNLTRNNFIEHSFAREFVLYAVDLQQSEQPLLESQPTDELAAIVVKIPKVISRSSVSEECLENKYNNFQEARFSSTYEENAQNHPIICSQSIINVTAILPSGIHSLPSKGGPSSLIQRWRSGGSCDCGGWDLGCKLRILVNQNKVCKKPGLSLSQCASDKFEFITQGGEDDSRPMFSLAPFKDGIYSVEFNSSLSVLQAFSLCIAVLDGKKLCESSEPSMLSEEKTSLETVVGQNDGTIRASNGATPTDGELLLPARYVSYPPPHSPVGRV